jgi:hypothetical protein
MWPRIFELFLAAWLGMSPFVFGHYPTDRDLWINDFACAAVIAVCALLSLRPATRRAHLVELVVAAWLIAMGYLARSEALPALQNNILVAFVLLMVAVIPTDANRPPAQWRAAGLR